MTPKGTFISSRSLPLVCITPEQLIDSAAGDAPSRPAAERDPEQGPGPEEPPGLLFADGERCGRLGHGHCVSARRGQFERREVVRVDAVIGGPGEEGGGVSSFRRICHQGRRRLRGVPDPQHDMRRG